MRRRLISYLDALFVGMLLGLIFVTVMHAAPLHHRGKVQSSSLDVPPSLQKTIADAFAENATRAHERKGD